MPLNFVKEMFCDRLAAGKIYKGKEYNDKCPLEYFLKGKGRRRIHPKTSDLLESWLEMLANEGEEKTFEYIRRLK